MSNRRSTLLANSLSNNIEYVINIDNYLTIEALEDGLTAKLSTKACEYCIDGDDVWYTLAANTTTPSIKRGQVISFRGNLTPSKYVGIGTFTISKKCNLKGNCMSMLFGDDAENNYSLSSKDYAFYGLFSNCTNIIEVSPNFLSATTLVNGCYDYMFSYCTSLTTAPDLPATTLASNCYYYMFNGCTRLTTAPELPATTLANDCYAYMFQGCASLVTPPPILPATTLANDCYAYMFQGCTRLTTAPGLPATTLADSCYSRMFAGTNVLPDCSNIDFYSDSVISSGGLKGLFSGTKVTDDDLKNILPINQLTGNYYLPATTLANSCYQYMFGNCTSLTTAPELPANTLADYCYNNMFSYCTSLTTAPELPATALVNNCYSFMFYNCKKLNYIKAMFTTTPNGSYTGDWVYGVSSTGTFVKNKNATWNVTGNNGIPSGWTVLTA